METIVQLQTPQDLQYVLLANELVTETFYAASDNPLFDAINQNSYRMRSAAQTLGLHMTPGRGHATCIALAGAADVQQQRERERFERPWRSSSYSSRDEPQAAGVVNVTLIEASPSIAAAAGCDEGEPFAMLTNVAVAAHLRRRGIAHQLMQAAIRAAMLELDCTPSFAMLLAYKNYEPAFRLYQSWGFADTPWVDPLWLADAETGKLGRQRATMMVKPLSGPGLTSCPALVRLQPL